MSENTRIYVVTAMDNDGNTADEFLVKAASQAQAIRHVVGEMFHAEVAEQEDLVRLVGAGKKVGVAGAA
jgi:hypothetical protein